MQVSNNNVNFCGVIPTRVFVGNTEITDGKTIHRACTSAVKALAGPLSENPQFKPAAAQLSVMDSDYRFQKAFFGYTKNHHDEIFSVISDFFKIIFDRNNKGYIVTGQSSNILSDLGKQIGRAKKNCKINGIADSEELRQAQQAYWQGVSKIGNNSDLRIREAFNPHTLQKFGKQQQMDIYITTKERKLKGQPDLKVMLDHIEFSDRI